MLSSASIAIMKSFFLIVALISFASSLPVENSAQKVAVENPVENSAQDQEENSVQNPLENPVRTPDVLELNLVQGDMLLTPRDNKTLFEGRKHRSGLKNLFKRWPGGVVYYQFSDSFRKLPLVTAKDTNSQTFSQQRSLTN